MDYTWAQNKNKASETIYYIIVFPSNAAMAGVDAFRGVILEDFLFCFVSVSFSQLLLAAATKKRRGQKC